MKTSIRTTVILTLLFAGHAFADLWAVPVVPGETFRWVFVTSTTRHAIDTDIGYYNDFVNTVADTAGTSITGVLGKSSIADIEWKAIGSTTDIYAIDNIGTTYSSIFTPYGSLVANNSADLFDGSILVPVNITENGSTLISHVWTGTEHDGTSYGSRELGSIYNRAILGDSSSTIKWLQDQTLLIGTQSYVYAISEELTVVPTPTAVILGILGLGTVSMKLRKKTKE